MALTQTDSIPAGLNQVLADTYALMALTHFAHWNVEGSGFFALHTAFEEQYTNLFTAADEIAERTRALGAYAIGGLRQLADLARIDELTSPLPQEEYVKGLIKAHEKLLADAKKVRELADREGDTETEDLIIARVTFHEKTLWMLRSFLKA
ncbi:MAG: DNA starvation/stationary phase protection protein [Puniceicoccaceae bacterium]|nr:MAG: DNA starvation/stationary phase protection protein [Puniceicoccaceae bacterium]